MVHKREKVLEFRNDHGNDHDNATNQWFHLLNEEK